MAGSVLEALSVLSAAAVPKGPSFVRRPEFSQELVREAEFNKSLSFSAVIAMLTILWSCYRSLQCGYLESTVSWNSS